MPSVTAIQLRNEFLTALISGRNGRARGGAAEHGAERDSHRGGDPADVQPAAGPGEQHEQLQAETGGGTKCPHLSYSYQYPHQSQQIPHRQKHHPLLILQIEVYQLEPFWRDSQIIFLLVY